MTNDLTTVEGSFQQLIDDLENNLQEKGVNAQYDATTGIRGLVAKILDIKCNSSSKNVIARVTGNSISLGENTTWLTSIGDVVIDWGDGTSDTVNNPSTTVSHTYTDGLNEHFIIFNGSVTSIKKGCFTGNLDLTTILILDSVTSLGNRCFESCSNLTSVVISDSVTSLEYQCFYQCSSLTSVIIPNSVTSLENNCFSKCGLTSVTIPNSVTSLGDFCFNQCLSLTSVTIPNSVTSLGIWCFYDCQNLVNYELYWETQPIIYKSTSMPVNTDTIFTIPYGTTSIYVDAGYPSDRLVERIPPADTITITSTKNILSPHDSEFTMITATLSGEDIPIPNTELDYTIVDKDDNLLDNGTVTTNANGEAYLPYFTTGIGDVTVTFSLHSLLQKTFVLEDCNYWNTAEVTRTSTDGSTIYDDNMSESLPTNCEISFDIWSNNSNPNGEHRFFLLPKSLYRTDAVQPQYALYVDQVGGNKGRLGQRNNNTTFDFIEQYSLTNSSYHTVKIIKTNDLLEFYIDDTLKTTEVLDWINNYTDYCFSMMRWTSSGTSKMKNIKIKTL